MAEFDPPYEIDPEMVPTQGFNPLFQHVSPPRQVMMGGNLAQCNVIKGATRKRQRSGLERKHTNGTFIQKIDVDSYVVSVIPRYTEFDLNPSDLIIIQHADTGMLDCINMPRHHVLHQHYGFKFERREDVMQSIRPKARISKDTILATSPNVTRDGDYMPGVELNVVNLDDPAIAEDGLVYSHTVASKIFQTTGIESRIIECGSTHYPANLYGTGDEYCPIPNIGQTILPSGIIAALRPKDKFLDPVYMSRRKLLKSVFGMDDLVYGKAKATVIDIRVWHNDQIRTNRLPEEMSNQFRKYYEADKEYYRCILETVMTRNSHSKLMSRDVNLSNKLWGVVDQAIKFLGPDLVKLGLWPKSDAARLNAPKLWRGQPMDEWRVELTFEYQTQAAIGPKSTDLSGSVRIH